MVRVLIIDEMSMVDTWLMNLINIKGLLPDRLKILLVGDSNQLPSVGPGQVLARFAETKSIPSWVEAESIVRQINPLYCKISSLY